MSRPVGGARTTTAPLALGSLLVAVRLCSGAGSSLKRSWSVRVPRQGPGRPRKRPDRVRADKAYDSPRGVAWACRVADSGFRVVGGVRDIGFVSTR